MRYLAVRSRTACGDEGSDGRRTSGKWYIQATVEAVRKEAESD